MIEFGCFFNIRGVISIVIFITGVSGVIFCRYIKNQFKFANNLRRKVYFLNFGGANLQAQKDKLKTLGLFNLDEDIKDISDLNVLQSLKKKAVYIVSYSDSNEYKKLFQHAENEKIPIIIFANPKEIRNKDNLNLINNYIYCDIVNTTNRLAIILLNTLKIL